MRRLHLVPILMAVALLVSACGTEGGELSVTDFVDGDEMVSGVDADPTPTGHGAIAVDSASGAAGETDIESAPADTVGVDRYTLMDLG